ncbi:hypothetical protein [Bacteroides cellulosilyticus]|uniref:hypothetical protein n=1 Tax=Bacteroides cellulosilyticus TaxID=246787 RepID=UPI0018991F67|nr:hypothetical protein [Bacteroides cellulosilyticus]
MKKLIYLLFIITFISCNKSEDSPVSEFAGNYKIVSIISEKAVDMNNDGIVSNDVYLEIISPYHLNSTKIIEDYYSFDFYYAEMRPLKYQTNNAQFANFSIPCQHIEYTSDGSPFLAFYLQEFIFYTYEFTDGDEVILTSNSDHDKQFGCINSMKRTGKDTFVLNMNMNLFDFKTEKWIDAPIQIAYQKIPDKE